MFKRIVVSIIFCTVIISCEEDTKTDPLLSMPLQLARGKVPSAIGITPDGKTIVINTGSGKVVKPCRRNKASYTKDKNSSCEVNLVDPNQETLERIKNTETTLQVEVLKNGQKVAAVLSSIVVISIPNPAIDSKENISDKPDSLTFMDNIIASASAQTVVEYCSTIFSGGTERVTCITEGNSCLTWRATYGEATVLSNAPQCGQYY